MSILDITTMQFQKKLEGSDQSENEVETMGPTIDASLVTTSSKS